MKNINANQDTFFFHHDRRVMELADRLVHIEEDRSLRRREREQAAVVIERSL